MTHVPAVMWSFEIDRPDVSFRCGRSGEDYVAEWPGVLSLLATPAGDIKQLMPTPGADADAVEKLRHGAARAFLRSLAGKPSLHASAVSLADSALICVGPSGVGKSTIADRLCRGYDVDLLADDVVAVDLCDGRWTALPSETQVWLSATEETFMPKKAVAARAATRAAPIGWIVSLCFDDSLDCPKIRRLAGASVGAALLEASVRFEVTPQQLRRELDLADSLASQTVVYGVARPHGTSAEAVAELLVEIMEGARQ